MIHDLARRESPFSSMFELVNLFDDLPRMRTIQNPRLKTDLVETDSSYVAKFDVPGLTQDDINIAFENHVLSVATNITKENECCEEGRYRIRERSYEQASRSFHLPEADPDSINAVIEKGVLTITANKNKEAQARKIEIACKS